MKKYTKVGAKSRKNKKNKTRKFHKKMRKTMRLKKAGSGSEGSGWFGRVGDVAKNVAKSFVNRSSSSGNSYTATGNGFFKSMLSNLKTRNYKAVAETIKKEGDKAVQYFENFPKNLNQSMITSALNFIEKVDKNTGFGIIDKINEKSPGSIDDLREIARLGPEEYYRLKREQGNGQYQGQNQEETEENNNNNNETKTTNENKTPGTYFQAIADTFEIADTEQIVDEEKNIVKMDDSPIQKTINDEYNKTIKDLDDGYIATIKTITSQNHNKPSI